MLDGGVHSRDETGGETMLETKPKMTIIYVPPDILAFFTGSS